MALRSLPVFILAVLALVFGADITVNPPAGPVVGREDAEGTISFLGIPFAEPPLNERRWRKPEPKKSWSEPLNAFEFRSDCAQGPNGFAPTSSEDCLFLQVWTPSVNEPNLPVQVWHYGGSFLNGSTSYPMYNGAKVARENNVVVVSMNYRMGVFGFLGHEVLRSRNDDGSVGNYGLQDQQLALQWVQSNIAAFGGDPSLVTAFGESAGAASVALHMLIPGGENLFQRAILESGGPAFWSRKKLSGAEKDFDAVSSAAGCKTGDPKASVDCMLGKSTVELLDAAKGVAQWAPVIDQVVLLEDPIMMAQEGKFVNKVPTLLGSNKDEGTAFATILPTDVSGFLAQSTIGILFGIQNLGTLADLYPTATYASPWWCLADILGDWAFTCPTKQMARWMSKVDQPVYRYYFTRNNTKNPSPGRLQDGVTCIGTCHGIEIPYVFQAFQFLENVTADEQLSKAISTAWSTFAARGDPNHGGLPVSWPRFNGEERFLTLDLEIVEGANLKDAKCEFFDQLDPPVASSESKLLRLQKAFQKAKSSGKFRTVA